MSSATLKCEDCGIPYDEFGLDTTIENLEWEIIHPEREGGILCASCMVKRAAATIDDVIAARMYFQTVPRQKTQKDDSKKVLRE